MPIVKADPGWFFISHDHGMLQRGMTRL